MLPRHSPRGVVRVHATPRFPPFVLTFFVLLTVAAAAVRTTSDERAEPVTMGGVVTTRLTDMPKPPPEAIVAAVRLLWGKDADRAEAIVQCESRAGADKDTWDVSAPDGGPMQINRSTWEAYFWRRYGWTWEQIVLDLQIHLQAAREIYDLADGWADWECADVDLAKVRSAA
jgi:hypothetical protein